MKRPRRAPPLSLEALEAWFAAADPPPHCAGVSMMDGFLTGLTAGPVFVPPNDWMWHVIGDHEKDAVIGGEIQAVIDTIVGHYNLVAQKIARGGCSPLFMRTDDEEVLTDNWADGFFGAVRLNLKDWRPLFARKDTGEPAMAILYHCSKAREMFHSVFQKRPAFDPKDSWRAIPIAVEDLYRCCAPMRVHPEAPANDG